MKTPAAASQSPSASASTIGPLTGLDWSDPAVTARFDPYIAWVEWIGLAGRGVAPDEPLPFLIEFDGGAELLEDLHRDRLVIVPRAYRGSASPLRFCSGYVRLADLRALPQAILRMQLGLAANPRPIDSAPWVSWVGDVVAQLQSPAPAPAPAATVVRDGSDVIAVIDDGCAFAHRSFRSAAQPDKSRLLGLWDQGRVRAGDRIQPWAIPADMTYGSELDAAAIDQLMLAARDEQGQCNESACYYAAALDVPSPATGAYLHGTHVMDLAAGWPDPLHGVDAGSSADRAGAASLLFVQVPSEALRDSSGGWMSVHVLDALRYVLQRTSADDRVVVNLSLAAQAGPHDGSSLLERAMDHLLQHERSRNLQIVVAAGNGYEEDGHARLDVSAGGSATLRWSVAEGDATDSFLEIWLPPAAPGQTAGGVHVSVRPPGAAAAQPSPALAPGQLFTFGDAAGSPRALALYAPRSIQGSGRSLFLLSLAPTRAAQGYAQAAADGEWLIELDNRGKAAVQAHAWIERDGERRKLWSGLGQPWVGKQSSFAAPQPDPSTTLGSLACGARTLVVGAVDRGIAQIKASAFTASGPALPPSQRQGPDLSAPGSDSSQPDGGIVAAQGLGGATTSRRGTSMAAPIVARHVLNAMSAAAPEALDRSQVIARLLPGAAPQSDPRLGLGTIAMP